MSLLRYDWRNSEELERKFDNTKIIIQNLLEKDGEFYVNQLELIKSMNNEEITKKKLKKKIESSF